MNRLCQSALLVVLSATSAFAVLAGEREIDSYSYRLGGLGSFAEMVHVGVKKLALSAAVSPDEMDELESEARRIASEQGVLLYRETDLIVTDLFPAGVAEGKHVLLIYMGSTLQEYLDLKKRKQALEAAGTYQGAARKEIAMRFGELLSYPADVIEEKIRKQSR